MKIYHCYTIIASSNEDIENKIGAFFLFPPGLEPICERVNKTEKKHIFIYVICSDMFDLLFRLYTGIQTFIVTI